jgi:hypothetical protein
MIEFRNARPARNRFGRKNALRFCGIRFRGCGILREAEFRRVLLTDMLRDCRLAMEQVGFEPGNVVSSDFPECIPTNTADFCESGVGYGKQDQLRSRGGFADSFRSFPVAPGSSFLGVREDPAART